MGFKSNGINDFDIEALKREQEEKKRLAKLEEERAAAGSEPVERLQPPHGSGAVHSVDAAQSAGYDERTIKQNPGGAALRGFLIFSPVLLRCARSRARSRAADTGAVLSAAESLSSLHERLPACLPRLFRHPSGHFP